MKETEYRIVKCGKNYMIMKPSRPYFNENFADKASAEKKLSILKAMGWGK